MMFFVQVAYSYTYELRPYLDLLLQILLIEDSWQTHRSECTFSLTTTGAALFERDLISPFPLFIVQDTQCVEGHSR